MVACSSMTLVFVLFVTVLTISFVCSLLEAVFLSITPAYVSFLTKEGRKAGPLLEHLRENIGRPISAILTLNTISHTLGASLIGAMVQQLFGQVAVTVASMVLTFSILILSEIIPKILGVTY